MNIGDIELQEIKKMKEIASREAWTEYQTGVHDGIEKVIAYLETRTPNLIAVQEPEAQELAEPETEIEAEVEDMGEVEE